MKYKVEYKSGSLLLDITFIVAVTTHFVQSEIIVSFQINKVIK